MDLKLAEYKDGKFLRYLELAKNRPTLTPEFLLAQDFVYIKMLNVGDCELIEKDKTDPLKRFNGLFDGRTYGEGRYVLVSRSIYKEFSNGYVEGDIVFIMGEDNQTSMSIGGLHLKPQLFKELNND